MADRPIPFSAPMVRALLDGRKTQTRRVCKAAQAAYLAHVVALDVPPQPGWFGDEEGEVQFFSGYAPGDRLWVREAYYQWGHWEPVEGQQTKGGRQKWCFVGTDRMATFDPPSDFLVSRSKAFPGLPRWYRRLGRFMPRKLSRLTLTVTDVRVERLQDISEADAIAEGVDPLFTDAEIQRHPECAGSKGFTNYLWHGHVGRTITGKQSDAWRHQYSSYVDARGSYSSLWESINGPGAWEANPWVAAVTFVVRKGNIDG